MDQELIQRTRYVLRARFRRAQTCPDALFPATCAQVVTWLDAHPLIAPHIHALRNLSSSALDRVQRIPGDVAALQPRTSYSPDFYSASTTIEHAALCLRTLEAAALPTAMSGQGFLLRCLAEHLNQNSRIKLDEAIQTIRDVALDGLFEHLDENLDSRNVTLALLEKYRQRASWFQKERLRSLANRELGRRGERALAMDLYEYLLDQSVEFYVEASSSGGEADVVLRDPNGAHLVLDAKHIRQSDSPGQIKKKLADGFHQVAQYCEDYQEPAGFLVVFSESPRRLSIDLDSADGWRYLPLGGRTIYLTEVSIADSPSASKLGKADEIRIERHELLAQV